MEKKLTDEEIVKAFEYCNDESMGCVGCPYKGNSCRQMDKDTLDLIHRLQDENKRLTKEHERIAWSKQEYMDWVHGFLSTHTDMKDRGEKFEAFDRDWMCNVFWEKIVGAIEYIIDLENQRNELQKQVDEQKAEKVFNEVMSCIGSLQMFWIVDGKARPLVDAEKLFEKVGEIAKKHEICFDEELEPKPANEGKTIAFPKFKGEEVE